MSEGSASTNRLARDADERALSLGEALAERLEDPEAFVSALRDGLADLAASGPEVDRRSQPGADDRIEQRAALARTVQRPLRIALAESSAATALWLAQRLSREEELPLRLFALPCLERCLVDDPERSWQLLRQLGRRAGEPIEVDALAEPFAHGIRNEGFRWAELEQLVYSDHVLERRLVGSTLALLSRRPPGEDGDIGTRLRVQASALIGQLIGDAEPRVQETLSWAIREWTWIDQEAATAFLRDQASIAVERGDGHRAWVVRGALAAQPPAVAEELRRRLEGIERDPDAPATSMAAERAAAFAAALPRADVAVGQQGQRYTRARA